MASGSVGPGRCGSFDITVCEATPATPAEASRAMTAFLDCIATARLDLHQADDEDLLQRFARVLGILPRAKHLRRQRQSGARDDEREADADGERVTQLTGDRTERVSSGIRHIRPILPDISLEPI
jgi:hypothetical protein